jgi:hypothetical protein
MRHHCQGVGLDLGFQDVRRYETGLGTLLQDLSAPRELLAIEFNGQQQTDEVHG